MQFRTSSRQLRRGAASMALVLVLVIAQFAILGIVLGGARDQDLSVARVNSVQAFYAAEAGVNLAIRELLDDVDHDGNGEVGGIADTSATQAALYGASVAVSVSVTGSDVSLTSLGVDVTSRHSVQTNLQMVTGGSLGTPHGLALSGDLSMKGSGRVDAFDSSTGVFTPWVNNTGVASVATNATGSGDVDLKESARVVGDVYIGAGGNPSSAIKTSGSAVITGTRDALDEALSIPAVTTPPGLPASAGNKSYGASGMTTVTAGTYHYGSYEAKGSHVITISGAVTIYCDGSFEMKESAKILLNPGATLTLYAAGLEFKGSAQINMPASPTPANPSFVQLLSHTDDVVEIKESAVVVGQIIAPESFFEMKGSGVFFGTAQADAVEIKENGRFTQDLALTGSSGGGSGSGGSSTVVMAGWSQVAPQ